MAWPADGQVRIRALGDKSPLQRHIQSVALLGQDKALSWLVEGDGLRIDLRVARPQRSR
ncbi:MAG: alpha-L-fucosidase C-terminal domain-containing protein [Caldilineaceae bacterium]